MKLQKTGLLTVLAVIIWTLSISGCKSETEQGVKQPGMVEKPAPTGEKPVPAVVKPAPVAEKPAPAIEKKTPSAAAMQNVPMALKFVPGDSTKYKVMMEGGRKVKWEGAVPDKPGFQSGENTSGAEMTFTQKIDSINSNRNAVVTITIDGLKYVSKIKENTVLDFDSSRAQDANNPMVKLIGQSYKIELTPFGQVNRVIDVNSALAAVKGDSATQRTAMRLLDPEVIKDRHGTLCLPVDKSRISPGKSWKDIKTFPFGWMGTISYERVFTLKTVENKGGHSIAMVEMKAIPAAEMEKDKNTTTNRIAKNFDNKGDYKGELKFDSSSGKVEKFTEELTMEWMSARPSTDVNAPQAEPTALIMDASRLYSIEQIEK